MNRIGDTLIHTGANEALVEAFTSCGVEFLLVGGLAVAWFCSERQADDMDLLVSPTEENSRRVAAALTRLRVTGFDEQSFTRPGLQVPLKQTLYADLLTPETGAWTYERMQVNSVEGKLFQSSVRIASPETLIYLKERAIAASELGVAKHRQDIEMLRGCAA